jgi:hypothetical protein
VFVGIWIALNILRQALIFGLERGRRKGFLVIGAEKGVGVLLFKFKSQVEEPDSPGGIRCHYPKILFC